MTHLRTALFATNEVRRGLGAMLLVSLALVLIGARSNPARAEPAAARPAALATKNVILITVDGLRADELFRGVDPLLLANKDASGIESEAAIRERYWRSTPHARRRALLPFFWSFLAPQGAVFGNRELGSQALLRNPLRFSFPGYAELLTGRPQPDVTSNDRVRIRVPTILDYVADRIGANGVASFASWDVFDYIVTSREEGILSNAGYERLEPAYCDPEMARLNEIQFTMMTPWDTVRHDTVTAGLALGYIRRYQPRFLYLALGETDDWAHQRRYDRVLLAAKIFDDTLRDLWTLLQSLDAYRDQTTLIITTDHGRGRTGADWTDHGERVDGAEDIWIAVIGPDTPDIGEAKRAPTVYLSSVAATVLELLGFRAGEYHPDAASALPAFIDRRQ